MRRPRRAILAAVAALLATRLSGEAACSTCPNASFGPSAQSIPLPSQAYAMVTADFDGDGVPDVVVEGQSSYAYFFRGLAGGGFAAPVAIAISYNGYDLAAADLDGDGKVDLVLAGIGVIVLWGNGNGTFSAPQVLSSYGSSLAVGDVDGDGKLDIVAAGNTFSVLLNLGGRAFETPINYGTYCSRVVLGDFDGDGKLDVVAGVPVQLFRGAGDGTFPFPPVPVGSTGYAEAVSAADLNGDGKLDLLVVDTNLWLVTGLGDGTFGSPVPIATIGPVSGFSPHPVEIVDWNGDGWPDVIAGYGTLSIIVADGHGFFRSAQTYEVGTVSILALDFDGDGFPDVLSIASSSRELVLFGGTPAGTLATAPTLPSSESPRTIARGIFGGASGDDIAVLDSTGVQVWVGDGAGRFVAGPSIPIANQNYFAVADFNADGRDDVVTVEILYPFFPPATRLHVFLAAAGGGFTALAPTDLPFVSQAIRSQDIDGDSKVDIVLGSSAGPSEFGLHVLKGVGDGTFTAVPPSAQGTGIGDFVLHDLDGDGKLDIASIAYNSGTVSVLLGHGDGTFGPAVGYSAQGFSLVAKDFDGDGHVDLVTDGHLTILRGHGDGTFDPGLYFPSIPFGDSLVALDFDWDGQEDVAMEVGADLVIFRGMGDGTFRQSATIPTFGAGGGFGGIGRVITGDWNGDVRPDLAFITQTGAAFITNTSCLPRRLRPVMQPLACETSGSALAGPLAVAVYDDGANLVSCAFGNVTASIAAFTGAAGATLSGTLSRPLAGGAATFPDLAIDLPHAGYRLELRHPSGAAARTRPFSVRAAGAEPVFAPSVACVSSAGNVASVGDRGPGTTYAWTVGNGTITSGQGTPAITFTAGASGLVTIDVVVTESGSCAAAGSRSVPVAATCGLGFFSLPPCRVADTRFAEGPALAAGALRTFAVGGRCGVPAGAASVAVNVAVTGASTGGNLILFPAGAPAPTTSTINYAAGRTRSNNAALPLGPGGGLAVQCSQPSGTVHLILDVTGYFQ